MDLTGRKVAILVHNYFEQAELEQPLKALQDAGVDVTIVSASGEQTLQAMKEDVNMTDTFDANAHVKDVSMDDFDGLVVPGGTVNADHVRTVSEAQQLVKDCMSSGKPLAVICHGPWLLVSAGLASGKRLTSFPSLQDDLKNAGANWVDEEVVVDNNLITSRNPDDLPAFCSALVSALA